jgi:hypothetical protein
MLCKIHGIFPFLSGSCSKLQFLYNSVRQCAGLLKKSQAVMMLKEAPGYANSISRRIRNTVFMR